MTTAAAAAAAQQRVGNRQGLVKLVTAGTVDVGVVAGEMVGQEWTPMVHMEVF